MMIIMEVKKKREERKAFVLWKIIYKGKDDVNIYFGILRFLGGRSGIDNSRIVQESELVSLSLTCWQGTNQI